MGTERESHYVQSLARGLSVITAFGPETPELSLSDVARATGLTRAAARRFLLTLVDLGHVRQDGKLFRLTPRVLTLGYAYLSSLSLPGIAEPHLERLVREVHESSSMSVLDGHDIVYVARVPDLADHDRRDQRGHPVPGVRHLDGTGAAGRPRRRGPRGAPRRRSTSSSSPSTRSAPRATCARGSGETRAQGYALVDQELEHGLRSIAAPVRNRHGNVVAAVNVSSHVSRVTRDQARDELLPAAAARGHRDRDRPVRGPSTRRSTMRTRVVIVGAGPAGLLLSHLLDLAGRRVGARREPLPGLRAGRIRAGVLESSVGRPAHLGRAGGPDRARGRRAPRHLPAVARASGTTSTSSTTSAARCGSTARPRSPRT